MVSAEWVHARAQVVSYDQRLSGISGAPHSIGVLMKTIHPVTIYRHEGSFKVSPLGVESEAFLKSIGEEGIYVDLVENTGVDAPTRGGEHYSISQEELMKRWRAAA
jgi:hypothetical protein